MGANILFYTDYILYMLVNIFQIRFISVLFVIFIYNCVCLKDLADLIGRLLHKLVVGLYHALVGRKAAVYFDHFDHLGGYIHVGFFDKSLFNSGTGVSG